MSVFTVFDLLETAARRAPGHPALLLGEDRLTYAELRRRAESLAAFLRGRGVKRWDRVGIHLRKSFEEVVATFAVARLGATFVNLSYQWTRHQVGYVLDDCGLRALITDARKARELVGEGTADRLDLLLVQGVPPQHPCAVAWPGDEPATLPPCPAIDVDLAGLLYTSGSTGQPKGVMLTHANIVAGARSVGTYLRNSGEDRILSLPPMSFDYGMNQFTTMFLVGGTVALQPVAMPAEIVRTVRRHGLNGLALVSPSWVQLIQYLDATGERLEGLRYVTNTGGKIPPGVLERMPECLPGAAIYLMYGLTEAFRSTYLEPGLFHEKMGAIGEAIPNQELFVVDPEHGLCGPDEPGELIHRGSLICAGYWGMPEATAEKIKVCEHLVPLIGREKVLHSGDIVRRDSDGIMWFVSRSDAMIKSSGFRISSTEVEDQVHRSGLVQSVVAFGVEDDEQGQVVHVSVEAATDDPHLEERLAAYCRRNLPAYMVPRRFFLWPGAMPRTANGKIDRPAVIQGVGD